MDLATLLNAPLCKPRPSGPEPIQVLRLEAGNTIVVTDGEYDCYSIKGVYFVSRDCCLESNPSAKSDDARFEAIAMLVLDGSLTKINTQKVWLGSSSLNPSFE